MSNHDAPEMDQAELAELLYRKTFFDDATVGPLAAAENVEAATIRDQAAAVALWARTYVMHDIWAMAYRAGVEDERMSEANIGVAGCFCNTYPCRCKIQPARVNPYPSPRTDGS